MELSGESAPCVCAATPACIDDHPMYLATTPSSSLTSRFCSLFVPRALSPHFFTSSASSRDGARHALTLIPLRPPSLAFIILPRPPGLRPGPQWHYLSTLRLPHIASCFLSFAAVLIPLDAALPVPSLRALSTPSLSLPILVSDLLSPLSSASSFPFLLFPPIYDAFTPIRLISSFGLQLFLDGDWLRTTRRSALHIQLRRHS
ncbi:hypothetical protein C8R45DRAFT_1011259, partial [Mycena sanguinolenta]